MTDSTSNDKTLPADAGARPESDTHQVTLTHEDAMDGRIPVVVMVIPTGDYDAEAGVFVDLRLGPKDQANMPHSERSGAGTERWVLASEARWARVSTPSDDGDGGGDGDAAEDGAAQPDSAQPDSALPDSAKDDELAAAIDALVAPRPGPRPKIISHQIAQGQNLTTGQAVSFRGEISEPEPAPDEQRWYVRGRLSSNHAHDLKSAWVRI